MVEHCRGVEQHFEHQNRNGRWPQRGDDSKLDAHRQQDFDGMEAQSRRHVEFEIGVVHAVQPPQGRHSMKHHVLEIDG